MSNNYSEKIEQLRQLELKNIVDKLKSGKTLSKADQQRLAEIQVYYSQQEGKELDKAKWGYFTKEKDVILSTTALALILGYSTRHIQRFIKSGCPQERKGYWNLRLVFKWLRENNNVYMDSGTKTVGAKIQDEELKLRTAKAEKEEIELQILKGKLINQDDVLKSWQSIAGVIKQNITALSSKTFNKVAFIAGKETAKKVKTILEDEIFDALKELSEHGDDGLN